MNKKYKLTGLKPHVTVDEVEVYIRSLRYEMEKLSKEATDNIEEVYYDGTADILKGILVQFFNAE